MSNSAIRTEPVASARLRWMMDKKIRKLYELLQIIMIFEISQKQQSCADFGHVDMLNYFVQCRPCSYWLKSYDILDLSESD